MQKIRQSSSTAARTLGNEHPAVPLPAVIMRDEVPSTRVNAGYQNDLEHERLGLIRQIETIEAENKYILELNQELVDKLKTVSNSRF